MGATTRWRSPKKMQYENTSEEWKISREEKQEVIFQNPQIYENQEREREKTFKHLFFILSMIVLKF